MRRIDIRVYFCVEVFFTYTDLKTHFKELGRYVYMCINRLTLTCAKILLRAFKSAVDRNEFFPPECLRCCTNSERAQLTSVYVARIVKVRKLVLRAVKSVVLLFRRTYYAYIESSVTLIRPAHRAQSISELTIVRNDGVVIVCIIMERLHVPIYNHRLIMPLNALT